MTLVARFKVADTFTWIGDLLVTQEVPEGQPIATPLADNANVQMPDRKFYVCDLTQKVNLLSDRLLVAFAGDGAQARDVAETLSNIANLPELSPDLIKRVLDAVEPHRKDALTLIGAISNADDTGIYNFAMHADKFYGGPFGWVLAGGSGAESFKQTLGQFAGGIAQFDGIASTAQRASCIGLMLATTFYGREFSSMDNLVEAWGGGFEVIVRRDNAFRKLDNIVYLFWSVIDNADGSHTLRLMHKIVKCNYWGDTLLMRVVELIGDENGLIGADEMTHIIPPVLGSGRTYHRDAIPIPSFDCNYCCSFILASRADPTGQHILHEDIFSTVSFEPAGMKDVTFEYENDGAAHFALSGRVINSICSHVREQRGYEIAHRGILFKKRGNRSAT